MQQQFPNFVNFRLRKPIWPLTTSHTIAQLSLQPHETTRLSWHMPLCLCTSCFNCLKCLSSPLLPDKLIFLDLLLPLPLWSWFSRPTLPTGLIFWFKKNCHPFLFNSYLPDRICEQRDPLSVCLTYIWKICWATAPEHDTCLWYEGFRETSERLEYKTPMSKVVVFCYNCQNNIGLPCTYLWLKFPLFNEGDDFTYHWLRSSWGA